MNNLLQNWKTTSAGLTMIIGAIVHLAFLIKAKTADENAWTVSLLAILGGVGLIFAGDASKSATKDETKDLAAGLEATRKAVVTGDTTMITKSANSVDAPPITPETPKT